ncbi:hypothetical protein ISG33_12185 [Glaciecola sp. MH2013]|uniref:PKD domain-containing protein n=1 Tax=Glaciecola sp. MH2013 TaxID=2785524 RepID=UPI00189FE00D|nr:hypothetical protein [Glaciecola sp. MH2013]MBF7074160.1 hypothetical protein [Glaciecola sp. MH2013]
MMNLARTIIILVAWCLMVSPSKVSADSLFGGQFASYWLIDEDTGQITSFSSGAWINAYTSSVYIPEANQQVLVNNLSDSSVPMSPAQAAISIIGITGADKVQGELGSLGIVISPAAGTYENTIQVTVETKTVSSADTLRYRINNGQWIEIDLNAELSAQILLIENDNYIIEAQLINAGQILEANSANYVINYLGSEGKRRDSDQDGLPDLLEAELGLNPLLNDSDFDADEDGWSNVDTWIRCGVAVANEDGSVPCSAMEDSDGDGWTNFDELIRGTRFNDPEINLNGIEADSIAYFEEQQRYRDFPTARRLYEVEYIVDGTPLDLRMTALQASTASGEFVYSSGALLSNRELLDAGLSESDLVPRLLQDDASRALINQTMPLLRLPAGEGIFIRASSASTDVATFPERLAYITPIEDIQWQDYAAVAGEWNSIADYRAGLLLWLEAELTVSIEEDLDATESVSMLMFEQALREQASLLNESSKLELGTATQAQQWLLPWLTQLSQRFEGTTISTLLTRLQAATQGALSADASNFSIWTDEWSSRYRSEYSLSDWLSIKMRSASADALRDSLPACFISDEELAALQEDETAFDEFLARCPEYYTSTDVLNARQNDAQTRMRLRLALLPDGLNALLADASIGNLNDDSDQDSLSNYDELYNYALLKMPLPWLSDTDDDGTIDGDDSCPNDPTDACALLPRQQVISLDEAGPIDIQRLNSDTTTLVALRLQRPADSDICVSYSLESSSGLPEISEEGEVCFKTGQQVILLPILLPASENSEAASLVLTLVESRDAIINAQPLQINFRALEQVDVPEAIILSSATQVNERAIVILDGSSSSAANGSSLSFQWSQISGIAVSIPTPMNSAISLTLPEVITTSELVFQLSVSDNTGQSASSQITISILPVEDAPRQVTVPRFVINGLNETRVPFSDFLVALEEPDGDPINIGSFVSLPNSVTATRSANEYSFRAQAGGSVTELAQRRSRSLRPWNNNGISFVTMTNSQHERFGIFTWTAQEGLKLEAESMPPVSSFSNVYTAEHSDLIYYEYSNPDTSTTFMTRLNGDDRTDLDSGSFFGLPDSVVGHAGQLYSCSGDSQWQIVTLDSNEFQNLGFECDRLGSSSYISDAQSCLSSNNQVICSSPTDSSQFSLVYQNLNPDNRILRLVDVNDRLLMLRQVTRQENGVEIERLELSYLSLSGEQSLLAELPFNPFNNAIIPIENGFVAVGQDRNSRLVSLYKAQGNTIELLNDDLVSGNFDAFTNVEFSGAELLGNTLYISITENFRDARLFEMNIDSPDTVSSLSVPDYAGQSLSFDEKLFIAIRNGGEGNCSWYSLTPTDTSLSNAIVEDVSCFTIRAIDDQLIFSQFKSEVEGNIYLVYKDGQVSGVFPAQLSVDDGKGNSLNMDIELELQP